MTDDTRVSEAAVAYAQKHKVNLMEIEGTGRNGKITKSDVVQFVENQTPVEEAEVVNEENVFTYVGQGEDPPRVINFMGMQKFVRGVPVEVTNPMVLNKIAINPSFVQGEVDQEVLHEQDQKAAEEAEDQRVKDRALNAAVKKKHRTE